MPKFVLLEVIESLSKKGNNFHQAIVIDDKYNTTKIFITKEVANRLGQYKGEDITDLVSFVYRKENGKEYYQLYI